ncbi:MAG: DUF2130 domain-containing protein [Gammaproteobacteria bacterium]
MADKSINCPECGTEIEISTVLSQQIENDLKKENDQKLLEAVSETKKKSLEDFSIEKKKYELKLEEQNSKLAKASERELEIKKQQHDLEKQKEQFEQELESRLKQKEQTLREQFKQKAKQDLAIEMNDLQEQLKEKNLRVEEAQIKEMEVRKQARRLEEKQKNIELEFQRKIDQERKDIEDKISKQLSDESNLKLKEKEKQIDDLRRSLEDAKRKSEQGSMETQGEVLELDLEHKLKHQFSHDTISPVPKGIKGADIIQNVRDSTMNDCGKIIWEAKNTKNWSPLWLQKLKDDQREIGANIAILVTVALPESVSSFGLIEGVWVADVKSALPLASALREQLIQINFARSASQGKGEKMEDMFNYLSGDEFKQRVEAIVETFSNMQDQLNREKRAMERIWKEREKQIQRITTNTIGMYGDVRGIIGSSIQAIPALELDNRELDHSVEVQKIVSDNKPN